MTGYAGTETITYSASGLPSGLSLDTATGLISGTIDDSAASENPYQVTVTATDGSTVKYSMLDVAKVTIE